MLLDMSGDYLSWDNTVPVRYEIARRVPSVADLPPAFDGRTPAPATPVGRNKALGISVAKRRNLTSRELAASGGVYSPKDQVWLLPDALFPTGILSKPGDVIVEQGGALDGTLDGTRWTVLEESWGKNRQTRRLTCRNLTLAFDLRDLVTIERPAISSDAAGVQVKAYPSDPSNPGGVVLYANLPARAQLVTKEVAEQYGVRGLEGKYRVIVAQEVDVTSEDRLRLDNGLYLDVAGYENAARIDELPVVVCERRV